MKQTNCLGKHPQDLIKIDKNWWQAFATKPIEIEINSKPI